MPSALHGRLGVLMIATLLLGVAPVSRSVGANVGPGGFVSPNVAWVGNIPLDTAGIGARIVHGAEQPRLYVTSLHGLSIYDISEPTLPRPMGHLPMPHWENEDVAVSDDGSTVLITHDRISGSAPGLFIIDASVPQAPLVAGHLDRTSHTVTCVRPSCGWVYSSEGEIYDLRDPANPAIVGSWRDQVEAQLDTPLRQGAHDLNVDASGLVTTDTVPRLVLDVSDAAAPVVVGHSALLPVGAHEDSEGETAYQHNSLRPRAQGYNTRAPADASGLGPGEVLLANGETNFSPRCGESNGPFATWDMSRFDAGREMRPLDVFRPISSNLEPGSEELAWVDGDPAINAVGCSGHWFDWTDWKTGPSAAPRDGTGKYLVAAGWYEHGTRFLRVHSQTGAIEEVGFFQPVVGTAFAAYWATDEIAYVIDSVRGIDILQFDRSAAEPAIDLLTESWLADLDPASVAVSETDRYYCSIAAD